MKEIQNYLGEDGFVALVLCSAFASRRQESQLLRPTEWNQLARQIYASGWKRPAALLGRAASEIGRELGLPSSLASRLARLLERAPAVELGLKQLTSGGMWVMSRMDTLYPAQLRRTLKQHAPIVLFGAGDARRLRGPGLAIVGSRNIDEDGAAFAHELGRKAVEAGLSVISGGARGTDRIAMDGALRQEGFAVGILAESLEGTLRKHDVQRLVNESHLSLLTPLPPSTPFSVQAALGRNRIIYAMAESAIVVSSEYRKGGTWAGASEALKANWCPVFARSTPSAPPGNRELIKSGAIPMPQTALDVNLAAWLRTHTPKGHPDLGLFGD